MWDCDTDSNIGRNTGIRRAEENTMWPVIVPLIAGFLISFSNAPIARRLPVGIITGAGLLFLLAVMGARIGGDAEVILHAGEIGLHALLLALMTVMGSLTVLLALEKTWLASYRDPRPAKMEPCPDREVTLEIAGAGTVIDQAPGTNHGRILREHSLTLMLVGGVAVGLFVGRVFFSDGHLPFLSRLTTWVLALLLFGVGLEMGESRTVLKDLRSLGFRILLLPLGIAAGSIAGAVALVLLWNIMPWNEAAAVASGFGWYSLSAVIITESYSSTLGALAFMTNIMRELIAILTIPLIARTISGLSSIAPGGATTMDVTLPVVARGAGREYIPLAFLSGAVLSMLVPFLVRFFLLFG